jgi:anti-sigma regulatory factor (Ser/Thr protein kinase)
MESVSFQLPAGSKKIRNASIALRELLTRHKVKGELVYGCERTLLGLLAAITKHSRKEEESSFINVNLRVEGGWFYIETEDDGAPSNVDLEKVTAPVALDLQAARFDIASIKNFMDKVEYKSKDGKNFWVLGKNIRQSRSVSSIPSLHYKSN